jgi:hypothetical protein
MRDSNRKIRRQALAEHMVAATTKEQEVRAAVYSARTTTEKNEYQN